MKTILKRVAIIGLLLSSFAVTNVLSFNAGLKSSSLPAPYDAARLKTTHLNQDKLWSLVQEWRVSENLPPYIKDPQLCEIAKKRAPEIKNELENPHAGFKAAVKGSTLTSNVLVTENNVGALSETNALNQWLNSASHAAQLRRSDYKYSCIATDGGTYAVQVFANF